MHASDNRELSEAPNILRGNGFDVFDAMAAVFAVILAGGFFVGIECGADGEVADGMGVDLYVVLVEHGDSILVLSNIPEERAARGRIVGIRLNHGGGVSFNHAIELEFDGIAGLEPLVAEFFVSGLNGVEVLRTELVFR